LKPQPDDRLPYDLRLQIGKALDRLVCDESTPEQVDTFIETFAAFGLTVSALVPSPALEANQQKVFCAMLTTGVCDQQQVIETLRAALEWYANPEIYRPHPHGLAFDKRDLSYVARSALSPHTQEEEA
jgi:hypothetical protein